MKSTQMNAKCWFEVNYYYFVFIFSGKCPLLVAFSGAGPSLCTSLTFARAHFDPSWAKDRNTSNELLGYVERFWDNFAGFLPFMEHNTFKRILNQLQGNPKNYSTVRIYIRAFGPSLLNFWSRFRALLDYVLSASNAAVENCWTEFKNVSVLRTLQ